MSGPLHIALFYHSLVSDWNHGNAHFLRGIASELIGRGHRVSIYEPADSWSRLNLLEEAGSSALDAYQRTFPGLSSRQYSNADLNTDHWLDEHALAGVDLAIVHEWNQPALISAIGRLRSHAPRLRVLFHDTHHRALTAQNELALFDFSAYDGVLAYGASLKRAYEKHGWGNQVHVWHEAADTRVFYPRSADPSYGSGDVIWIGNWGDEERTEELREYFIRPVQSAGFRARVHGVRYPESAICELAQAGISYAGWLPNFRVPEVFSQFRATVHIPRRPYTRELAGIPTIRPFEALACAIPLVSAPWQDTEGLFRIGEDFLMAQNGDAMRRHLYDVLHDPALARSLAQSGLETIHNRHTCAHRVDELLAIYATLQPAARPASTLAEVPA